MSDARFKFTYKPEGVTPKVWEVDMLDGLKASELIAVKRVSAGGISGIPELMAGLMASDPEAIKALLWVMLKREMSTLAWNDLDFTMGEVQVDYADDTTDEDLMAKLVAQEAAGTLNELGERRLSQLRESGVTPAGEQDPKA